MIDTSIRSVLMPNSYGMVDEVRKFNDDKLQQYVDAALRKAQASGQKHAVFINYNLDGEIKMGVHVRVGDHLSFGGFLEKKPKEKAEAMAEVIVAF